MDRYGFISFLKKLHKDVGKPLILVVDRVSYHRAKDVTEYIESTQGEVVLEFLPTRSAELSPDKENVYVRADLVFQGVDEDTDPAEIVEWGAAACSSSTNSSK